MEKLQSIIRVSGDFYTFEPNLKLRSFMYKNYYHSNVDYIIVDYGEDGNSSKLFEKFSLDQGWKYIHCSSDEPLCTARAINEGIKLATSKFILLEDIDLIHTPDFYRALLENFVSDWDDRPFNFYSIPVAYLSQDESQRVENDPKILTNEYLYKIKDAIELGYADRYLQHFIPQSSLIILKKTSAEFIGLFDEAFIGWGGEDRDFVFRLLSSNTNISPNKDFPYTSTESGERICKYVGWKSIWTLHGDFAFNRGLLSFHIYHEERNWKKGQAKGIARQTIKYATAKAKLIGKDYFKFLTPKPLKTNIYIFGRNPHIFNEQLFDALGGFNVIEENIELQDIFEKLPKDSVVIFWNPWGSSRRLFIYRKLKEAGYSTYVAERGALPNSIVFDPSGLVIFSDSYRRSLWDKDLTEEEIVATEKYISSIKSSDLTLESQGPENNLEYLKLKYSLSKFKKKVLVCFQLSTDTVTNQNVEGFCSYPEFIEEVKKLVGILPSNYLIFIKNHPLTNELITIPNTVCVDDVHIHTLMELVDCVVVYNSGTGILARLFEKPVITFGPNSYSDPLFTLSCGKAEEALQAISEDKLPVISHTKVIRYFSYLVNDFYSFANFYDLQVRKTDKATLRYPTRISYYRIVNPLTKTVKNYCSYRWNPLASNLAKRFFYITLNQGSSLIPQAQGLTNSKTAISPKKSETQSPVSRRKRLKDKLLNNPYKYFDDSKYPIRWLRFLFKEK